MHADLISPAGLVLITPVGCHFLAAHRHVCRRAVPPELPFGIVRDPAPYAIGFASGAGFGAVPLEEEPLVAGAALAVARGLAWAAETRFETGPRT